MTRLSILIPWVSDDCFHEDTLASVLANRPDQCEILVVHRGAYADPYDLGSEVRFVEADSSATPLGMLNLGADEAEGDVLHILHPGIEVTEAWADEALKCFADEDVASVVPLVTDPSEERVLVAGVKATSAGQRLVCRAKSPRSTELARLEPTGPSLLAGFYRIECWDAASGLDESMGATADIDLALCLKQVGTCRLANASVVRWVNGEIETSPGFRRGRTAMRFHHRFADHCGFSASAFWIRSALRTVVGFYRPALWGEFLGQLTTRRQQRDRQRFERRWDELEAEAAELSRVGVRNAA